MTSFESEKPFIILNGIAMKAMQNSGDNTNSDIIITNDINNENFGVTVRQESHGPSDQDGAPLSVRPTSPNGSVLSARGNDNGLIASEKVTDSVPKKSSNRNIINFLGNNILGYLARCRHNLHFTNFFRACYFLDKVAQLIWQSCLLFLMTYHVLYGLIFWIS